jgi:mono/diheme cytochrome c family protein
MLQVDPSIADPAPNALSSGHGFVKEFTKRELPLCNPADGNSRSFAMIRTIRSQVVLAVVVSLAGAVCFAQSSGEATYKAKCQMCHGSTGVPNPGIAKMMGIKPVSDPAIKKLTAAEMFTAVKNGKGKMKAASGLTDAQIKEAVAYYRGLK